MGGLGLTYQVAEAGGVDAHECWVEGIAAAGVAHDAGALDRDTGLLEREPDVGDGVLQLILPRQRVVVGEEGLDQAIGMHGLGPHDRESGEQALLARLQEDGDAVHRHRDPAQHAQVDGRGLARR